MKIVFMGTPDFAVPILETLAKHHDILAVVCQPDRPKGRGHGVVYPPVKESALRLNLPVHQPEKVRGNDVFFEELKKLDADIFVVVAYGQILPTRILKIPPLGCVNIHASLLPKYRGAAPMQRAILNGDRETGVTIMYMDKGMDTGDMILKESMPINDCDRFAEIHDKMADLSCKCILDALKLIETGNAPRVPQDNNKATYAAMLSKDEGYVNWNKPSLEIVNQVRALDPWPGTYTYYDGQVLKIWECSIWDSAEQSAKPGTVLESQGHLLVKTGDGALSITMLQAQGAKRMNTADYLRGRKIELGAILG